MDLFLRMTRTSVVSYDGSAWVDSAYVVDLFAGWEGNMATEIAIPWTEIGSPTSLDVMMYAQWQDEGNVWASFPQQNQQATMEQKRSHMLGTSRMSTM